MGKKGNKEKIKDNALMASTIKVKPVTYKKFIIVAKEIGEYGDNQDVVLNKLLDKYKELQKKVSDKWKPV